MRYCDYRSEDISCADAQFGIAIALSFLGEHAASQAVLTYLGTNTVPASEAASVVSKRGTFEKTIYESELGVVPALLQYFDTNAVLEKKSESSRVYSAHTKCTLSALLQWQSIDAVYKKTMSLCLRRPAKEFILYFMDTEEYYKYFAMDARKAFSVSADKFRKNDLGDGIIADILYDFKERVYKYSTDGTYDPSTGTPVAFLRGTFEFYKKSSGSTKLYEILNTSGQDKEISAEDGTTSLDLVGIEDPRDSATINFMTICSKICKASTLLFRHSGNPVAFYDIFSYHRDQCIKEDTTKYRNLFNARIHGCSISCSYNTTSVVNGDYNSINSKWIGRTAICAVLEDIVTNGLNRRDIYDYYVRILKKTDEQLAKNGARLFSTATHTTRHTESNGNMMQILVDGYLALRELLIFLDSSDNVYGVSVNNFPVLIFRDAKYLKRFKSLEEYVNYVNDVSQLVNEVEHDPARNKKEEDGIYNNDTVYDIMSSKKLLNDSIFCTLRDMPLSYIQNAVVAISDSDKDANLYRDVMQLKNRVSTMRVRDLPSIFPSLAQASYSALLEALRQLGSFVLAQPIDSLRLPENLHYCIEFCDCLQAVMRVEECPVHDADGAYLLDRDLVRDQFDYVADALVGVSPEDDTYKTLTLSMQLRIMALHKIYCIYTGVDKSADFSCTWEDLHNVFCINTLYKSYFSTMQTVFGSLFEGNKDLYLILAKIARYAELLKLPSVATKCTSFAFLYGPDTIQYSLYKLRSASESVAITGRRDALLVKVYNNLMQTMPEQFDLFERLATRIDQCMHTTGQLMRYDPLVEGVLSRANSSIIGTNLAHLNVGEAKTALGALSVRFDYLNFLEINNKRFSIDNRYFFHREGLCVNVDKINKEFSLQPVSSDHFTAIKMSMNWGGGHGRTFTN